MNAEFLQAAAEWVGILLTVAMFIGNFVFTANNYRMLANFVTKAEHGKLEKRVTGTEEELDQVNVKMEKLATTDDLGEIYDKLNAVDGRVANMAGTMTASLAGLAEKIGANNNMLNKLIDNELEKARGKGRTT